VGLIRNGSRQSCFGADESSVEELGISENDFERRMSEEVADVSRRKKCD
jgi:hypothetical protein